MGNLTTAWCAAREPRMAGWRLLVALAWFTAGLCILLALSDVLRFTYHTPDSGVFGWIRANRYPKQQELFWFLSAVAGVPAVMLAGWCAWAGGSAAAARLGRGEPALLLKRFALWHLPLLAVWPRMIRLRTDAWKLLLVAAGCTLIMAVATVLVLRFILPRFRYFRPGGLADPSTAPCGTAAPDLPRFARKGWTERLCRILRWSWRTGVWLLCYVAVPGLLYLLYLNPGCDRPVDLFHEGEFLIPDLLT